MYINFKSIVIVTLLTVSVDAQDLTKVEDKEPKLNKEDLKFKYIELKQRSYK